LKEITTYRFFLEYEIDFWGNFELLTITALYFKTKRDELAIKRRYEEVDT
jgi:hypothetical protein